LIALSAANRLDILGCNGPHADGPGDIGGPNPSRHGVQAVSSSYPRLRPNPDRPDDEGKPGGLKAAHLLDVLADGQVDFLNAFYREVMRLLGARDRDASAGMRAAGA